MPARIAHGATKATVPHSNSTRQPQQPTPHVHGGGYDYDPFYDSEEADTKRGWADPPMQGIPSDDTYDSVVDNPTSRTLYWVCVSLMVLGALVVVIGVLVIFGDWTQLTSPAKAMALELNIQRAIYMGVRADVFCAAERIARCASVGGSDVSLCGGTADQMSAECQPAPELLQLFSASGVVSALNEHSSNTEKQFASQVEALQEDSRGSSSSDSFTSF